MPVFEIGTNFPNILGRKSYPRQQVQRMGIQAPAALVTGETPIHLAQKVFRQVLPPRGTGLITGTARAARGMGTPLTTLQRAARHRAMFGQRLRKLPILKRFRGQIRYPQFGIGPLGDTSTPAKPYVRTRWSATRRISEIPSVLGITPGPEKSVHASSTLSVESI